jgi:hypothetical protein
MKCKKCGGWMSRLCEDFYFCNECGHSVKQGEETECNPMSREELLREGIEILAGYGERE